MSAAHARLHPDRILQQLGGSFGVAILAIVLQRELVHQVPHAATLAAACGQTFWWALAFIALAAIPALMLPGTLAGRRLGAVRSGGVTGRGHARAGSNARRSSIVSVSEASLSDR